MVFTFPYSICKHGFLIRDLVLLIKCYCQYVYLKTLKSENIKIGGKKDEIKGDVSNILQTMENTELKKKKPKLYTVDEIIRRVLPMLCKSGEIFVGEDGVRGTLRQDDN